MNLSNDTWLPNETDYRCGPGLQSFREEYIKVHGWASLVVCIFGSIANTLNIAVLSRREMCSPTNTILTGLAVADLLVMLEYIPYASHAYLYHRSRRDRFTYGWTVYVFFHSLFTQACHTVSICLTVILAVWRYIAVAHPQRNREWCSSERTWIAIVSSYIICPLICLPVYFTTRVVSKEVILNLDGNAMNLSDLNSSNLLMNETLWFVDHTETMKNNKVLFNFVDVWVYSVVIKLIPCAALTVLSLRLIWALMEAKERRKLLTTKSLGPADDAKVVDANNYELKRGKKKKSLRILEKERQTDRTTKMLLAVLLLFLLTEFPQGVIGLLSGILGSAFFRTCYIQLGELMDILALINSAINFILYCAMSRQFRTTFSQLFCRWRLFGRWIPVSQHPENNGHTATTHTVTQVTQV